ncbi:hypothetical protein A3K73_04150 [Candidatus Pacearchaeota archaeon RBG_13_36_9]|nr:MAG: hypothetical protein A3K73_04150 [Candidatus Pacearchaeota archaeon RBG_13_36_9]
MYLYDFVWANKEIFKLVYTLIIGLICFLIVLRTHRLFKLSFHQGIRYFRNAFFFYGLAFVMRYILGLYFLEGLYPFFIRGVFEFFLIMAGFSLLYSLLWRKFEPERGIHSSLFNLRFAIFYLLALIVAVLDYLWGSYFFMFLLQIILFISASIISYVNYKKSKKNRFLRLYFIVIILNLLAWLANFLVATFFNWQREGVISIYVLNILIFFLFLYGVMNATKKQERAENG